MVVPNSITQTAGVQPRPTAMQDSFCKISTKTCSFQSHCPEGRWRREWSWYLVNDMAAAVDECMLLFPSLLSCNEVCWIFFILLWCCSIWVVINILLTKSPLNKLPTVSPLPRSCEFGCWNKDYWNQHPLNKVPTQHSPHVVPTERKMICWLNKTNNS